MMSCVNSVQDVHELGDKNEQFKLILRLIFRVENFPTRSKVHTGEDTKSKREKTDGLAQVTSGWNLHPSRLELIK